MHIGQDDRYHEECGVVGVWAPHQAVSHWLYYGLFAIQHRGQEACGMAISKAAQMQCHKACGLVSEVFSQPILDQLEGDAGIGHVRYGTTGESTPTNAQPMVGRCDRGMLAVAHNGNLSNTVELRERLQRRGAIFQSTTDTEIILHLLARDGEVPLAQRLLTLMDDLQGSYALVVLNDHTLYAARDPRGCRPLCLGKLNDAWIVASESCVFETLGASFVRDLAPGEVLVINEQGVKSYQKPACATPAHCVFEYVYFARPDSVMDGISVSQSRRAMGSMLAKQVSHLDVDVVIAVPDSGTIAAMGLASAIQKPMVAGILKNRYTGRTFIQPTQALRDKMVRLKLNPIEAEIAGKRLLVVDDSIVRGTTSRRLIERLREKGAREVHFVVTCPPVTHPCYYGIDTGVADDLMARHLDQEQMRQAIGADSLTFLSLPGLLAAVGGKNQFCTACLTGCYPCGHPDGARPSCSSEKELLP